MPGTNQKCCFLNGIDHYSGLIIPKIEVSWGQDHTELRSTWGPLNIRGEVSVLQNIAAIFRDIFVKMYEDLEYLDHPKISSPCYKSRPFYFDGSFYTAPCSFICPSSAKQ